MLSFCELHAISVLDGFTSLVILKLENAELLILRDIIVLKRCYVMLYDVLITLVCYRSLHVNRFDPKGDLNSCFRIEPPLYDLETSCPNYHAFRCRFITIHIHMVVVYSVGWV